MKTRDYTVKKTPRRHVADGRKKVGFSLEQQKNYRRLVEGAWRARCESLGWLRTDKDGRDAWTRGELCAAVGHTSTKDCDTGRDYERACAHFEELEGAAFDWQMRAENGDETRMRWWLKQEAPGYLEAKFGGNRRLRDYLLEIAGTVTGRPVSQLRMLTDAEWDAVRTAMLIAGRRWMNERQD